MRDYRRAGLALPKAQRDEVEKLRKELSAVATDFDTAISSKARRRLPSPKPNWPGLRKRCLPRPGSRPAMTNTASRSMSPWQYLAVLEHVKSEAVRQRVLTEQHSLAKVENAPLIGETAGVALSDRDEAGLPELERIISSKSRWPRTVRRPSSSSKAPRRLAAEV